MNGRKTFIYSFLISSLFVMVIFGGVYMAISSKSQQAGTPQEGVPMGRPSVEDSKTILLCIDGEYPYFFLFKFNAIENRIGIAVFSPSYRINQNTIEENFKKAGAMQCVLDTESAFDINIDYYLQCNWNQMSKLVEGMDDIGISSIGENLPQIMKSFILKGADRLDGKSLVNAAQKAAGFMDNEIGLAFLTQSRRALIENNLEKLPQTAGNTMKENYSSMITNINTQRLNRLDRILNFLAAAFVEYNCAVIVKDEPDAQAKVDSIIQ